MTNFADHTIWTGDNLDILGGLNSASVDLIYLDPPFNSNRNYAAPVGNAAAFDGSRERLSKTNRGHGYANGIAFVVHEVIA